MKGGKSAGAALRRRWSLIGLGGALALVLVAAGIAGIRITQRSPFARPAVPPPVPPLPPAPPRPSERLGTEMPGPPVRTVRPPDRPDRLLATFDTPLLSTERGRLANIRLAVQKIDGQVIAPGGEFSFNKIVGPREPSLGWQPAPELYSGEYVVGYGGGICQVSSTLFNAVLLAGVPVTERHHHSRPLSYVDLGRDATVAWSRLDFRFRNVTSSPIRVRAAIVGSSPARIRVSLYGSGAAPGYKLRTQVDRYISPEIATIPDSSLPAGRRQVLNEGRPGYQVRLIRVAPDGREEVVATAAYAPQRGHVLVGTGAPEHRAG